MKDTPQEGLTPITQLESNDDINHEMEQEKNKVWSLLQGLKSNYYNPFLDKLDSIWISPNRLVTIRTGTAIAVAGILNTQENLWYTTEWVLLTIWALSLIADRVDGDLARHTDQCSLEWEVLDAWADKVVVYAAMAFVIHSFSNTLSPEQIEALMYLTGWSFVLDVISQWMRGVENNTKALKAYWKKPLTQEEREVNKLLPKSKNAANFFWKVKTGSIMGAMSVGSQNILPFDDSTKMIVTTVLVWISVALSSMSLTKKFTSTSD